ncbi:MAG: transglutaminase domain-containing protein [Cryobacterium sp.]|nr:transglutaminase domain-containing protein [Cryobacterium sp.]
MTERRPLSIGFVLAAVLLLWLGLGLSAVAFWPIFAAAQFAVMAVAAILVGTAIGVLGARYRWSSLVVALATLIAFTALGVPLAVPAKTILGVLPSFGGLADLFSGVALGWKQLLTIALPVGDYQALLVPPFALILVVTVIAVTIALRTSFGEVAAVGPVIVFLVGLAFGAETTTWPLQLTIALAAAIILYLIWCRWYRRRASIRMLARKAASVDAAPLETVADGGFVGTRTLVSAAVVFTIAAVAGVGMTALLPPSGEREVLRSSTVQPFDPRQHSSPLSEFRAFLKEPQSDRLLLTVGGLEPGARVRLATLDSYDGIVYAVDGERQGSTSGVFARIPYRIDQSAVLGDEVVINVSVAGYSGVWLPTIGELVSVDFGGPRAVELRDGFYYNDAGSTGAVLAPLAPGDQYRLTAVIPTPPAALSVASLEPNPVPLAPLPDLPDGLASTLDRYVSGVEGAGARLQAMLDGLAAEGYVSHGISEDEPPSRSGHSSERISELFTGLRMLGDAEQYAVAAALMARELGFPARVVVGFAPEVVEGVTTEITGNDISAWIEVSTSRFGWVALDPTPPLREIPDEAPPEPTTVTQPQTPVQPPEIEPDVRDEQAPPEAVRDEPEATNPWLQVLARVLAVLAWLTLAVAVALAPFLTIAAAKWRRRRLRRRAPTPLERITGGWQEFHDAALDHGYSPGAVPTRLEVAQAVGGTQPYVLAAVVDRVVFAPGEPKETEADQLWRSIDELRFGLGADRTRWERIKALVSLRSLGGYSVTRLFRREG